MNIQKKKNKKYHAKQLYLVHQFVQIFSNLFFFCIDSVDAIGPLKNVIRQQIKIKNSYPNHFQHSEKKYIIQMCYMFVTKSTKKNPQNTKINPNFNTMNLLAK
jgi:hypothetical protein